MDTVVIGTGMVGLASALALQARGKKVMLVGPDGARDSASFGNAGVISPGSILPMAGPGLWPKLPRYLSNRDPALRVRYCDAFFLLPWGMRFLRASNAAARERTVAQLATLVSQAVPGHQALAKDLGTTSWLRSNGWLRAFRSVESFQAAGAERSLLTRHGVAFDELDADQIRELEPALAREFERGLFLTDALSIDQPGRLLERALAVFIERGGVWREVPAQALQQTAEGVRVMTSGGAVEEARHAVLAAGAWSARLARGLGYRIPMVGERGYHLHLSLPEGKALNRPVNDVGGAYVMAPEPGGVRVLSGVELARPQSPPNPAQIRLVLDAAGQTLGVPDDVVAADARQTPWMGSRPSTPDGLPIIGAAPRHERIIFAFGHGHVGLSTGPATGQLVADLVTGRTPSLSLAPFAPGRFMA